MKTKKVNLLLTIIFLFMSVFYVGATSKSSIEEEWESRTWEIGSFSTLHLEGGFKVFLIQGEENSLEVKTSDAKAFDYLNVTNKDGILHLHVDRKPFDFSRVTLYLTFREMERMEIEGGITLRTRGYMNMDDFFIKVEGGSKIDLKAKARNIGIKTEGGVLVELNGVAESLNVKLEGAGHVDAGALKCKDVRFNIQGVGTGKVHATNTLEARIAGAGKIRYRGNPRVTEDIEGLGSIRKE